MLQTESAWIQRSRWINARVDAKVHFSSCSAVCGGDTAFCLTQQFTATLFMRTYRLLFVPLKSAALGGACDLLSTVCLILYICQTLLLYVRHLFRYRHDAQVLIHQLAAEGLFRKFNMCVSCKSWSHVAVTSPSALDFWCVFRVCQKYLFLCASEVKVEMTAPVSCRVDPGAGPACESQFTVSFYIPEEHQENPPEPSDPDVFVEHRKEFTAYVR